MEITYAMMMRDGGTASVGWREGEATRYATFDYRLPWDGRERFIYLGERAFDRTARLEIGSDEESRIIRGIYAEACRALGEETGDASLMGEDFSFDSFWHYVIVFLKHCKTEGRKLTG
jgi:hypothetical protein